MNLFGIGLSKTGSTSLIKAMSELGFEIKNPSVESLDELAAASANGNERHFYRLTHTVHQFREVDRLCPGSKFVLTTRDRESWLKSCRHHFRDAPEPGSKTAAIRTRLWGSAEFDEARFLATYERHLNDVQDYFRHRPEDLLVLNVIAGEGYEKLAPFVGADVRPASFPKENVSRSLARMLRKIKGKLGLS